MKSDDLNRFERQFAAGQLNRRDVLKRGALLGLSFPVISSLLAACGGDGAAGSGTTATTAAGGGGSATTAAGGGASPGSVLVPGLDASKAKDPADIVAKLQVFIRDAPYYVQANRGGEQAAKDLGITDYSFAGPQAINASEQAAELNTWITQGVDVVAASIGDPAMGVPINKAVESGMSMITFDVESGVSDRLLFVAPVDPFVVGRNVCETLAKETGNGPLGIISGAATSETQNLYIEGMLQKAEELGIAIVDTQYCDSQPTKAAELTDQMITGFPDMVGIMIPDGNGMPGVCQAAEASGGKIKVSGLSLPSVIAQYMQGADPVCPSFWLWNPVRVGYVAMQAAVALYLGQSFGSVVELPIGFTADGSSTDETAKLQVIESPTVKGGYNLISQEPLQFTPDNVGSFDF